MALDELEHTQNKVSMWKHKLDQRMVTTKTNVVIVMFCFAVVSCYRFVWNVRLVDIAAQKKVQRKEQETFS